MISNLAGLKDTTVYGVAVSLTIPDVKEPDFVFCFFAQKFILTFLLQIPNVEGKAGMAAIADPERKLDLEALAKAFKSSLATYARPLFIRLLPETPVTATFKLKKRELMEQGFDINAHNDPIYFLDPKTGSYVPLTQKLYEDLINGAIKL